MLPSRELGGTSEQLDPGARSQRLREDHRKHRCARSDTQRPSTEKVLLHQSTRNPTDIRVMDHKLVPLQRFAHRPGDKPYAASLAPDSPRPGRNPESRTSL